MPQDVINSTDTLNAGRVKINEDVAELYGRAVYANEYSPSGNNTTDDTTALQSALTAAAGKTLYVDKPSSKYRITAPLTVPSGTRVIMHPMCIIRQDTKWRPVFDLLDTPDVTIEGGQLRWEGDRDYNPTAGQIRGHAYNDYMAGVYTNSDRTVLRNLRVYGFHNGVSIIPWNGSTFTSYYVEDCLIDNLFVENVAMGIVASGWSDLTITKIRGTYTVYNNIGTAPPDSHLVYLTTNSDHTLNSRNLAMDEVVAYDGTNATAVQMKQVLGGTVGSISAYNCNGAFHPMGSTDISVGSIVSMNDAGLGQGSVCIEGGTYPALRVEVSNVVVNQATEQRSILMDGFDNTIHSARVYGNHPAATTANDVVIRGTRNTLHNLRYSNQGAGASRVVSLESGTSPTLTDPDIQDATIGIDVNGSSTNARVVFDPALVLSEASENLKMRFNNPPTTPTIHRYNSVKTYTTTAGAQVRAQAPEQTHAVVQANATNAFTIADPNYGAAGMDLTYIIYNNSGGTLGTITWGTTHKLDGTFTNPTNGNRKSITFVFDGTNWIETQRSG